MAEVCRHLAPGKALDTASALGSVMTGGVNFKDLCGFERLNGLDKADIEGFRIGVLPDLLFRVFPPGKAFPELIGTAAEDNDPVAREQVGDVAFHKPVHGNKFPGPSVRVDDLGITLLVLANNIGPNGGCQVNHGMPSPGKFVAYHRFSGTGRSRYAAHHSEFITCTNRSFSQSSPMLARM